MTFPSVPGFQRKRIPCAVRDGSEVVFDKMDGGLVHIQTSNGHYVTIRNEDLKSLVLFLMEHIFPDTDATPRV